MQRIEFHTKSQYGEHVWCQIGDLLVGVFYRSTNDAVVGGDNELKLHQVLQEMSNRNVLIMGDFNYAEIDWSRHTVSTSALSCCREFFRVVEDCFYTQHVLSPTRSGATLDLFFTNEPDLVIDVTAIQNLGSSDHNMVAFTAHLHCNQFYSKRSLRDYSKGDYDAINSALAQVEWDGLLNDNTRVGRFLPVGGKNRFFRGKNRGGKNSFCWQK